MVLNSADVALAARSTGLSLVCLGFSIDGVATKFQRRFMDATDLASSGDRYRATRRYAGCAQSRKQHLMQLFPDAGVLSVA